MDKTILVGGGSKEELDPLLMKLRQFYDVVYASDGEAVLKQLHKSRISAVILNWDISMRDHFGKVKEFMAEPLFKEIRKNHPSMPVIYRTLTPHGEFEDTLREQGCCCYYIFDTNEEDFVPVYLEEVFRLADAH